MQAKTGCSANSVDCRAWSRNFRVAQRKSTYLGQRISTLVKELRSVVKLSFFEMLSTQYTRDSGMYQQQTGLGAQV